MQKRVSAEIIFIVLLAIAIIPCCRQKNAMERMNVLVITIDTMRADHVGFYGDKKAQTPVLDDLCRKGIVFRDCYTSVPLTLPSHCSLFTGRLPITHGVRNNGFYRLGSDEATLARILKEKGYRTGALVAAYVLMGKFGLNNGFDWYDDTLRSDELAGDFDSEIPANRVYRKFGKFMAKETMEPFFLWVHLYDPHKPYAPPAEHAKRFPDDPYRGEIAFTDSVIGQMLQDLKDKGLTENTLVVVTGDHGEAFGEHEEYGHGVFCYEEDVRVPLIFSNPKRLSRPSLVTDRVRLIDIMPTILELLDMPVPEQIQGRSLKPLFDGERESVPRQVYLESMYGNEENNWAPLTGIISGGYKYLSLPKAELYDLSVDPGEKQNLLLKKNALARKMDSQLAKFVSQHGKQSGSGRIELSSTDKKQLQALGYISSFSKTGTKGQDPKDGIRLSNRLEEFGREMAQGKIDRVQRELEAMVKDPENKLPSVYMMLTMIYKRKQDLKSSLNHLNHALIVFRGTAMENHFRINLARLHLQTGKIEPAQTLADLILQDDPGNVASLLIKAEIAEKRLQTAKALEFLQAVEKLEPNNVAVKKKLAELFLLDKNIGEALRVYRQILHGEASDRNPELLFNVAALSAQTGDLAEAESLLREALAKKEDGRYLFHLALILAKKGDGEAALSALATAMEKHAPDLSGEQRQTARKLLARD
ncbi:MAG TPA: sulfatase-like hydrolase/transferase [Patescibacteria group bacterium]|nr:sulfatase-like hydrolase/transferase [Patescibacteria group bacterium]